MPKKEPNKQQGAVRGTVNISVNRLYLNLCPSMCDDYCIAGGDIFQMSWKMRFWLHGVTNDPMPASVRAEDNPGVLKELCFR